MYILLSKHKVKRKEVMATPIKFYDYSAMMTACVQGYMAPYYTIFRKWRSAMRQNGSKEYGRLYRLLEQSSKTAELEVFQDMCRNIASVEIIQLKRGGIHIHPRISWEHSWSELSFYLQLSGDIVSCTDGNARLSVCGYRPRAWKKAVTEYLSAVININDKVIGNKSYYDQVYSRIEAAIAEPFAHLTLVESD
jgi:hypothetical protein